MHVQRHSDHRVHSLACIQAVVAGLWLSFHSPNSGHISPIVRESDKSNQVPEFLTYIHFIFFTCYTFLWKYLENPMSCVRITVLKSLNKHKVQRFCLAQSNNKSLFLIFQIQFSYISRGICSSNVSPAWK